MLLIGIPDFSLYSTSRKFLLFLSLRNFSDKNIFDKPSFISEKRENNESIKNSANYYHLLEKIDGMEVYEKFDFKNIFKLFKLAWGFWIESLQSGVEPLEILRIGVETWTRYYGVDEFRENTLNIFDMVFGKVGGDMKMGGDVFRNVDKILEGFHNSRHKLSLENETNRVLQILSGVTRGEPIIVAGEASIGKSVVLKASAYVLSEMKSKTLKNSSINNF